MNIRALFALMGCTLVASALAAAPKDQDPAIRELESRIRRYEAVKSEAARGLPKLRKKSTPEEISAHKQALRARVAEARAAAQPGEVLGPAIFDLVSAVRSETQGPDGDANRDAILGDGNPVEEGVAFRPEVNAHYPEQAPRSTVPPDVLTRLPTLPKDLELRFVGKTLILYDSDIDLIVDYVAGVIKGGKPQ